MIPTVTGGNPIAEETDLKLSYSGNIVNRKSKVA